MVVQTDHFSAALESQVQKHLDSKGVGARYGTELSRRTQVEIEYLDAKGVGARYGFSSRHWLRLVDRGDAPPPTRFGRLVRWRIANLESWEQENCPSLRTRKGGRQ